MIDTPKNPPVVPAKTADDKRTADATAPAGNGQVAVAPILPASNSAQSPALFGGHKGGKKTVSGFPVDSPEHAEFMRKREAERSQRRRDEARALATPPVLPKADAAKIPVTFPADAGSSAPLVAGGNPVPLPAAGAVVPVAGGFVAWSTKMLQKPAALALRMIDRLRKMQLNKRIDRLGLTPAETAEVKKDLEWQEAARRDFEDSLSEVSALALNKAGVTSEYAPYINLTLSGGELIMAHLSAIDRLEKMYQLKLAVLKEREQPKTTSA